MQWLRQLAQDIAVLVKALLQHSKRLLVCESAKEMAFRNELAQRIPLKMVEESTSAFTLGQQVYVNVLRRVLEQQLGLTNLFPSDDLMQIFPDMPVDEVLRDSLELLQASDVVPHYDTWNGTFGDLVRVLEENIRSNVV